MSGGRGGIIPERETAKPDQADESAAKPPGGTHPGYTSTQNAP
jgi:hypothetical protein